MINLSNKVRFSNAGWQLAALLPVPSKKAGNYSGKMKLAHRKTMLFHGNGLILLFYFGYVIVTMLGSDCISTLMETVNAAFNTECQVECSDGYTRDICPLVAAWLGDREEHELIASIIKVQTPLCSCTH